MCILVSKMDATITPILWARKLRLKRGVVVSPKSHSYWTTCHFLLPSSGPWLHWDPPGLVLNIGVGWAGAWGRGPS